MMSSSNSRRLVFKKGGEMKTMEKGGEMKTMKKGELKKMPGPKPATRGKVTKGKAAAVKPNPKPQQTAEEEKKFDDNDRKLAKSCSGPNTPDEDEVDWDWYFNTDLLYLRFRIHEHKRSAAAEEEEEVDFRYSCISDGTNLGMDTSDPHFAFRNAPAILNAKKFFDSTHTNTVDLPRSVFRRKRTGFS